MYDHRRGGFVFFKLFIGRAKPSLFLYADTCSAPLIGFYNQYGHSEG